MHTVCSVCAVLHPFVVVQVQGKVNTISLDKCSRTGLVFDDVIATVEVVNCQSVQVRHASGPSRQQAIACSCASLARPPFF
jgi:hypothetical protein